MPPDPDFWDPIGALMVELRDDPGVAAICGANPTEPKYARVRAHRPAPGDARGVSEGFRAFIVLGTLGLPPHPQVPLQRDRHVVRCYGRDDEEAAALAAAASAALHGRGPRLHGSRGIYVSHDDTGASASADPDTQQPVYTFVVETLATTQAVAT